MNKQSVAKVVISEQLETFIYVDEDGDLIIEQPDVNKMLWIGKTHLPQFAEAVMELVMMRSEG